MFLKSLTLKGFKSFAEPTTLDLEPGVTVVVGPNGSGKSNVVDAVAWVLGAQGPRVVRSSKMDDVIFAGTAKRSALGRAEVSLTIDNSSGRLPIGLSEVTVTRTLFRTGESEYAINGASCRLLDVQELLSDAGVGRQQHVIVGQGQLDAVLQARPEDRRMVLEEAAGVLKFRRRRERAERRLESSESGLARLEDLLREVRRQLKPLERQAASALRHEELVAEERSIALYLAGRELVALEIQLEDAARGLEELAGREKELTAELSARDEDLARVQAELGGESGDRTGPLIARLTQLEERARGLLTRCAERRRSLAAITAAFGDESEIRSLRAEAAQVGDDLGRTEAEAEALVPRFEELADAEARLAGEEAQGLTEGSGDADPAPSLGARLVESRRAAGRAREVCSRAREAEARLTERAAGLERTRDELRAAGADAEAALVGLREALGLAREAHEAALARAQAAEALATAAVERRSRATGDHHAAAARVEVLEMALDEARARAGVERLAGHPGVLGTLLDVVEVDEGYAPAFQAAVSAALDAVLVEEPAARGALGQLASGGAGGAVLPVRTRLLAAGRRPPWEAPGGSPETSGAGTGTGTAAPPEGTEALRGRVRSARLDIGHLLDDLLGDVLVCAVGLDRAIEVALTDPRRTIVTLTGQRLSLHGWHLGSGGPGATRAALAAAEAQAAAAGSESARAAADAREAEAALAESRRVVLERARELDRVHAEVERHERGLGESRRRLGEVLTAIEAGQQGFAEVEARLAASVAELGSAEEELALLEAEEAAQSRRREAERASRRAFEERARALLALRRDLEVRVAGLEERRKGLLARRAELEARLERRTGELEAAAARRPRAEADDRALGWLAAAVTVAQGEIGRTLAGLRAEADRHAAETKGRLERLGTARSERERLERSLAALRERRQRLEIAQAEARVRHETAVATLARDLESVPAEALDAPKPSSPSGTDPAERAREVARELRLLGPVNPLAREELAALQERSTFLEGQLEDVRTARRELNQVIRAIDSEIVGVFAKAFADVAGHFSVLFSTLFPGGEGRLTLTAPDDLLSTGVEIEARPAGRNVRRLSLLSGGERSLVALAFLFAVFRSRPSPFYLMDEVEAALDEVNLRRFLTLVEEFRDEAQLIIVSHQKKTMEIADALYGITMQPGGASKAVSERVRRLRPAAGAGVAGAGVGEGTGTGASGAEST